MQCHGLLRTTQLWVLEWENAGFVHSSCSALSLGWWYWCEKLCAISQGWACGLGKSGIKCDLEVGDTTECVWWMCICECVPLCMGIWLHPYHTMCFMGNLECPHLPPCFWPEPFCSFIVYPRVAGLGVSGDSLISTFHLAVGELRLQIHVSVFGFYRSLGIQTQVHVFVGQALYLLNHLPNTNSFKHCFFFWRVLSCRVTFSSWRV